jgi:asparagine synthase (glutamine-hydrolysing)
LDDELVTFSLRLPENYKLNGLQLRWFFKEALRDFLPEAIINKPKHGFGLPFGPWLLVHDRLRELARHSVAGLVSRGLVRSEFVSNLWDRQLPRHPGYYGEMVWILTMLEQWIQSHAPNWRL